RDGAAPDGQAAVRLLVNKWQGLHTTLATATNVDPLMVGVSSTLRRFDLPEFSATPRSGISALGWGVSVDAMVPLVPATARRKAYCLTATGSYVIGSGIADFYPGLTGGVTFPALPNPMNLTPAPAYTQNVDGGLALFDGSGNIHTINWQSF